MSWKKTKIGDILTRSKNPTNIDDNFQYKRVTIKINHNGIFLRDCVFGKEIGTKKQFLIKGGQFLVSKIDARYGAFGIVPKELDGAIITGNFWSYDFSQSELDIHWFNFLINSESFYDICERSSSGITHRKYLDEKKFLNFEIFLPKIEEQKQIANKLKQSKEKQKNLQTQINNQKTYLKNLRKQILQDAIEGKLTKDWREQNPDIEPASELLKKIKQEKEKLIAEKKIKKEKPLPPIEENEIPFELPESWVWTRLGEIGIINPRNLSSNDTEASFIPMPLISNKYLEDPKFEIRKWGEIKSGFTHFADNDVAVAKITPCFENSKACVFKNLKNGFGAGTTELYIFRGNINLINPEFIYSNFKSQRFLKDGEFNMRGVAGQKRVPVDFVRNFIMSIPPYKEQLAITSKLQTLMQKLDEAEKAIEDSLNTSNLLTKSILTEAFKE